MQSVAYFSIKPTPLSNRLAARRRRFDLFQQVGADIYFPAINTVFQKTKPPNFGSNFVKSYPILKILSLTDSAGNFAVQRYVDIPPNLTYVATLPCKT